LDEFANEMSALRQKLPAELLDGEDYDNPAGPEQLRESLEDIKELLVNRLLSTDQEP
jgi:hypothetical protein